MYNLLTVNKLHYMREEVKYKLRKLLEKPYILLIRIVNSTTIKKITPISRYQFEMKCKDIRIAGATSNKMLHQHMQAHIDKLKLQVDRIELQLTENNERG